MFSISTGSTSQDVCSSFLFLQGPKHSDKQMSSTQIIQHFRGTPRCSALPSGCSKNILTAVSAKKTVWWCSCCFDIHSSVRPRLHTQLNCSVFTHTGRLLFGNQTDAKNKTTYAKQRENLLAKSIVGVCCFKKHSVVCLCFLLSLPWEKEWREV